MSSFSWRASDAANVRGTSMSYQLEDVLQALHMMRSGASLVVQDAEVKRRKQGAPNVRRVEEIYTTRSMASRTRVGRRL